MQFDVVMGFPDHSQQVLNNKKHVFFLNCKPHVKDVVLLDIRQHYYRMTPKLQYYSRELCEYNSFKLE